MRADTFMRGFEWPRKRPGEIYTSKFKKFNFRKEYRDCIKGTETRLGCKVHAIL